MAVLPFTTSSSSPFQMAHCTFCNNLLAKAFIAPLKLPRYGFASGASWNVSYKLSRGRAVAQFIPDKAKVQMKAVKERFLKSLPDPIKDFPWKEAGHEVGRQFICLGLEAFKCSFIGWFVLSFLSDILLTIASNRELLMPVGLFVGCYLSEFMKDICEELFQQPQVDGINRNFVGITCIFVVIKLVASLFNIQGHIFLVHVANGGLLQNFWLWRRFQEGNAKVL